MHSLAALLRLPLNAGRSFVGVWRQQGYGNVRWRSALVIGVASVAAAVGGAQVAESLPEHVLRKLFAVLLIAVAGQLTWQARRKQP